MMHASGDSMHVYENKLTSEKSKYPRSFAETVSIFTVR